MTDFIQETLKQAGPNGVVLFSKTYCPYCANAKEDLSSLGIAPILVELDQRPDGDKIQAALLKMTGQRTVPSAWVGGVHIGGSGDVYQHVQDGMFDDRRKIVKARKHAEHSGMQHCGAEDGAPCIYLGETTSDHSNRSSSPPSSRLYVYSEPDVCDTNITQQVQ